MERDPQRARGSFIEGTDLIRVARTVFAILVRRCDLRLDLSPTAVEGELV